MSTLQYSATRKAKLTSISIGGSLDAKTAPTLGSKLEKEIKGDAKILVINLEKLDYIASAGLGILINANEQLSNKGGQLRLCHMTEKIKKIFKLLGFLSLFKVYKTESDATE